MEAPAAGPPGTPDGRVTVAFDALGAEAGTDAVSEGVTRRLPPTGSPFASSALRRHWRASSPISSRSSTPTR